jgi:diacylglycerol kinase family enzyme
MTDDRREPRVVVVLINPKAGSGRGRHKIQELIARLQAESIRVEVEGDLAQAVASAEAAKREGSLAALVGAGGDGTIGELANRVTPGLPLAILPLGTENLVARHLGVYGPTKSLCDAIATGCTALLDAGRANGRVFLLVASCGFDAQVVARLAEGRKGHISHLDYLLPLVKSVLDYRFPEFEVVCSTACVGVERVDQPELPQARCGDQTHRARWAFVFNLPRYGLGIPIAPQADGTDGLLDVRLYENGSVWHVVRYLAAATCGYQDKLADFRAIRARKLSLHSHERVPLQLDGDPAGYLPAEIEVLPKYVRFVVPPEKAAIFASQDAPLNNSNSISV